MSRLIVKANDLIAHNTYKMLLKDALPHLPGQFVEIKVNDTMTPFLRRPFSVADYENGILTIVYKVIGVGTQILSMIKPGSSLDVIEQLGNGFNLNINDKKVTLIGGGCGCAPLLYLAKELRRIEKTVTLVMGFSSKEDCFFIDDFYSLGETIVTTDDGTLGIKGNVVTMMNNIINDYYFAVGPEAMLKAVIKLSKRGQISLEERMGCGFGACMGCTILTHQGPKRVCVEGPVFKSEDLVW